MRRLVVLALHVVLAVVAGCGGDTDGPPCESIAEIGNPCQAGKGECLQAGVLGCSEDGQTLVCDAPAGQPVDEICDGLDNDCDGDTDEDLPAKPADIQEGVCQGAQSICLGTEGWAEPDYKTLEGYEPEELSCDELDNDCDGEVDEPSVNSDTGCLTLGVCAAGAVTSCENREWICSYDGVADFEEEEATCDGQDNDCDGEVDEELVVPPDSCLGLGVCQGGGVAACTEGNWSCDLSQVEGYEESETSCDGLDNDCDGLTDEELAAKPADGSCGSLGVCAGAVMMNCLAGAWVCDYSGVANWESAEFSCDELDNDCDGEADEGWACLGGGCESAAAGSLKCKSPIGGSGEPAIDAEGTIYIAAQSPDYDVPYLAALSPADCSVLWEFHPPMEAPLICHPPTIRADGMLLFSCNTMFSDVQNPVYVVTNEGQLESTIKLPEGISPAGLAVAPDGTFYFGDRYCCGKFFAYNPDGSPKWVVETGGSEFQGSPARGPDGLIYAGTRKYKGSPEEKFYAFADNGSSGAIVWEFAPPETSGQYDTSGIMLNASPALNGEGVVYVGFLGELGGDLGTTLYALDAATGAKKWHHSDPSSHASLNNSLVIGPTGTVYMVTGKFGDEFGDPTTMLLHALSPDGVPVWAEPTPFAEFSWNAIPAIGKDWNLYVAAVDNAYCIDGQTGEKLWTYGFSGAAYGATLGHSGVLYFATAESVYAVCTDSGGLADSAWPKSLHDSRNTSDFWATP